MASIIVCTREDTIIRHSEEDAGIDLAVYRNVPLDADYVGKVYKVRTGVKVALPKGIVGIVVPRSSTGLKGIMLANNVGIIDPSYRGEIHVLAYIHNKLPDEFLDSGSLKRGIRIAQLLFTPYYNVSVNPPNNVRVEIIKDNSVFDNFDRLYPSQRSTGGFGSTGL